MGFQYLFIDNLYDDVAFHLSALTIISVLLGLFFRQRWRIISKAHDINIFRSLPPLTPTTTMSQDVMYAMQTSVPQMGLPSCRHCFNRHYAFWHSISLHEYLSQSALKPHTVMRICVSTSYPFRSVYYKSYVTGQSGYQAIIPYHLQVIGEPVNRLPAFINQLLNR